MCHHYNEELSRDLEKNLAKYEYGVYKKEFWLDRNGWLSPIWRTYSPLVFTIGKVYFDDSEKRIRYANVLDSPTYRTGFHARDTAPNEIYRYHCLCDVMIGDITGIGRFEGHTEISGRVMLIMTPADVELFNRDIDSNPVPLDGGEINHYAALEVK